MCKCKEENKTTVASVKDLLLGKLNVLANRDNLTVQEIEDIAKALKVLSEVSTESFMDSYLKMVELTKPNFPPGVQGSSEDNTSMTGSQNTCCCGTKTEDK